MKKYIIITLIVLGIAYCLYAQPGPIQPLITNLTQFKNQTAWRLFYSDGSGDVTELALGANTEVLTSNGTTSAPSWGAAGAGDITQVWNTASGDVSTPTIESGEYLDGGTATVDAAGEGILLPRGADVSAATAEGQISWDSDNDLLYVGDGAAVVSIAGSFDSTAVDATTWSDGANASNIWTFNVSGTDHTMTAGNGIMTFSHAVTVSGVLTGTLTGNSTTTTTASAGDAAVDFFGGGVTAVTDATTCTDIEGTGLSIAGGTLNWSAASTDLTDTADILYETELDALSELITQMADVTAFITDDDMPAVATNPDVDAAGEIGRDSDGANETGDSSLRGYDGANQFLYSKKIKTINFTLISPDTIDAADLIPVWHNTSGMTFTIVEWKAWSDDDDVSFEIEELTDQTDYTARTQVDACEISTNGTGVYYASDATITHAAIEHDHSLAIDFDTSDTPDYVQISISGWFNADVD